MFAPRPEIGKPDASHALRVRCGQKLVVIWGADQRLRDVAGRHRDPVVLDEYDGTTRPPTKQDIPIRLSRDILIKEIDWDLTSTTT
jgi:hypothetical protein